MTGGHSALGLTQARRLALLVPPWAVGFSTDCAPVADIPETHYATTVDGFHIAHQVIGDGPIDFVVIPGFASHVEVMWEWPGFERLCHRFAGFSRLIVFDPRGLGLSDRMAGAPTLEDRMEDLRAVLDAVGAERAAILGMDEGGPTSILFTATHPDRVSALVLLNSFARFTRGPDYPWGWAPEALSVAVDTMEQRWGQGLFVASMVPHLATDPEFQRFAARMERYSASPNGIAAVTRLMAEIDVRHVLDVIEVPTLVLHRREHTLTDVHHGRYLASRIRDAKLVELPGPAGHWDDAPEEVEEVEEFLTGTRRPPTPDRVLATVMFTDVVASTEEAVHRGDQQWRGLLDRFYARARREVEGHRGKLIKTTGDGVLATFDGPGRAIRCGFALRDAVGALGIEIRAGLHTGEVEVMGDDVAGIAVHIAARVMAEAGAAEVLVSSSVPPLVAGSGIEFADRGEHALKGVPGNWRLFAVENA